MMRIMGAHFPDNFGSDTSPHSLSHSRHIVPEVVPRLYSHLISPDILYRPGHVIRNAHSSRFPGLSIYPDFRPYDSDSYADRICVHSYALALPYISLLCPTAPTSSRSYQRLCARLLITYPVSRRQYRDMTFISVVHA